MKIQIVTATFLIYTIFTPLKYAFRYQMQCIEIP